MAKKAWLTEWKGLPCVVAAETRGKAVARTIRQAQEASWYPRFVDVTARRAPQWDRWAEQDTTGRAYAPEYMPTVMGQLPGVV